MHFCEIQASSLKICSTIFVLFFIGRVKCVDVEAWMDATCATLFSGLNFDGETFILRDWDQSGITELDFRGSTASKGYTGSIRVEEKCTLTICKRVYFQGTCQKLSEGNYTITEFSSPLKSANCTCERVCRCDDVFVPRSYCAMAYVNGSCNDCNSVYYNLDNYAHRTNTRWNEIETSTQAFKLRKGCNLTVWAEEYETGPSTLLTSEFAENSQAIGSYQCSCDNDKYDPPSASYSPLISLPNTDQELSRLALNLSSHPGVTAAIKSLEAGRSARNAYIVLIGARSAVKFSCIVRYFEKIHSYYRTIGHDIDLWGFQDSILCRNILADYSGIISEQRFTFDRDVVGVSNAQLRVITVPIEKEGNLTSDDRWIATLNDYLLSHEELKDAIPNAVVIVQSEDGYDYPVVEGKTSPYQRKLRVLNALRNRLLDENYSNVVHVQQVNSHFTYSYLTAESILTKCEGVIENNWNFPKPTFIVRRDIVSNYARFVNGYPIMWSGEYKCANILRKLILLSEKGGDALGNAIFKAIYVSDDKLYRTFEFDNIQSLLPNDHPKVEFYRHQMSNSGTLTKNSTSFTNSFGQQNSQLPTTVVPAHIDERIITKTIKTTLPDNVNAMMQNLTERFTVLKNETLERISKIEKELEDGRNARDEDRKLIIGSIWEKIKVDLQRLLE